MCPCDGPMTGKESSEGDGSVSLNKHQFSCTTCGVKFTRYENLKRHVKTNHEQSGLECMYCTRRFKRKDLLKRHISLKHPDHLEEYVVSERMLKNPQKDNKYKDKLSVVGKDHDSNKFHPPSFQAPDIPKSYKPKLHKYYSELPFLPPAFLSHYKELYFDLFHPSFPLLDNKLAEGEYVPAAYLRSLVVIACISTGLSEDFRLGSELWTAGMSLLDVFLTEGTEKEDRYGLVWVQACVPIFLMSGQLCFEVSDHHYMLFKRVFERCKVHEATILQEGDEKELAVRALSGHYIVDKFREIFNHAIGTISYDQLESRLPCGQENSSSDSMSLMSTLNQLLTGPVKLNEEQLTPLTLICAIYEWIQRERELEMLYSLKQTISDRPLRALENLSASLESSREESCIFWSLYYFLRLQILFGVGRESPKRLFFGRDPIEALNLELYIYLQICRSLSFQERVEKFKLMSSAFLWALGHLANRAGKSKSELPMERLIVARIVYMGWLLIGTFEQSSDVMFPLIAEKINSLMGDYIYMDNTSNYSGVGRQSLYNTIRLFCRDKLTAPGAWSYGDKLGKSIEELWV